MTSLIEKVRELKELEGRRQSLLARQKQQGKTYARWERHETEGKILDAAPVLLDVLGMIRAGDAEKIKRAATFLFRKTCDEYDEEIEMLQRMYQMAAKMEATK